MIKITRGCTTMFKHQQHTVGVGTYVTSIQGSSNKAYKLPWFLTFSPMQNYDFLTGTPKVKTGPSNFIIKKKRKKNRNFWTVQQKKNYCLVWRRGITTKKSRMDA